MYSSNIKILEEKYIKHQLKHGQLNRAPSYITNMSCKDADIQQIKKRVHFHRLDSKTALFLHYLMVQLDPFTYDFLVEMAQKLVVLLFLIQGPGQRSSGSKGPRRTQFACSYAAFQNVVVDRLAVFTLGHFWRSSGELTPFTRFEVRFDVRDDLNTKGLFWTVGTTKNAKSDRTSVVVRRDTR